MYTYMVLHHNNVDSPDIYFEGRSISLENTKYDKRLILPLYEWLRIQSLNQVN